jgi:hypothetical protein
MHLNLYQIPPHHIVPDPKRDRQNNSSFRVLLDCNNSSILDPKKILSPSTITYKFFSITKACAKPFGIACQHN